MSSVASLLGGRSSTRREVIEVVERKKEDKTLDKLMGVRKQRISRFEQERNEAREAWRAARMDLRDVKERWRAAVQDAKDFWRQARDEFFQMATTSGQFRKAKAIYERMKTQAEQLHLESRQAVTPCRDTRQGYFAACQRVKDAYRQQEKLTIMCDEIRLSNRQEES
jgi:hypothetical protein